MHVVLAIGTLLLMCMMMSTRAGRLVARTKIKRYEPYILGVMVFLWGIILSGFILD